MGFLMNALKYGWNAGCIITKAEYEANRICKNIKTTIIDGDEDDENFDPYGFKIIVHPAKGSRVLNYFGLGDSDVSDILADRIKAVRENIMYCLDRYSKKYEDNGQSIKPESDEDNL